MQLGPADRHTLDQYLETKLFRDKRQQLREIMEQLGYQDVRAPVPQWALTTDRVLVMERFYGTRVDDVDGLNERGVNAEDSLVQGMQAWFQCVVFHGFFHGDVHAGNLMLLDNEDIGFLDFGIVGRFDDRQRHLVTDYIVGFATSDFKSVAKIISDMGGISLPQLAITSFFGGGDTRVLEPNLDGPGGSLLISQSECEKEVERLLGKPPPDDPACSPGG